MKRDSGRWVKGLRRALNGSGKLTTLQTDGDIKTFSIDNRKLIGSLCYWFESNTSKEVSSTGRAKEMARASRLLVKHWRELRLPKQLKVHIPLTDCYKNGTPIKRTPNNRHPDTISFLASSSVGRASAC